MGPRERKELTALSELMVALEPYTRSSNSCPSIGFTVPYCHSVLSLGPKMSKMELVTPLFPPLCPPTPSGLIQKYRGHP